MSTMRSRLAAFALLAVAFSVSDAHAGNLDPSKKKVYWICAEPDGSKQAFVYGPLAAKVVQDRRLRAGPISSNGRNYYVDYWLKRHLLSKGPWHLFRFSKPILIPVTRAPSKDYYWLYKLYKPGDPVYWALIRQPRALKVFRDGYFQTSSKTVNGRRQVLRAKYLNYRRPYYVNGALWGYTVKLEKPRWWWTSPSGPGPTPGPINICGRYVQKDFNDFWTISKLSGNRVKCVCDDGDFFTAVLQRNRAGRYEYRVDGGSIFERGTIGTIGRNTITWNTQNVWEKL